jgi:tRNA-modifying protein YgfZ
MLSPATNTNICPIESGAWYTPLPGLEFTRCVGVDSIRFLQGQLTCNLQKLSCEQSLRGALCNLKGRVITDLQVLPDNDGVLLITQHHMRQKLISTLDKYRVFFKTKLEPLAAELAAFGMGGPDLSLITESLGIPLPTLPDQITTLTGVRIVRLPQSVLNTSPRFLCVIQTDDADAHNLIQQLKESLIVMPETCWQLADIRDGHVHIIPEQTELFTPQSLNYDINGVIDFKKGCYTGQEIVARMYYRAEAKKRLYHLKSTEATDKADNTLAQAVLADGSVESLVVLDVSTAQVSPGVTDFNS